MPVGNSISQFGVTFHFGGSHLYGQFADSSYWVKGPVTIIAITPAFADGLNGCEVNPSPANDGQGFVGTSPAYDPSYNLSLPHVANVDQSIVKTISGTHRQSKVKTAVVLTVLMDEPAGAGAGYFRPPYVGSFKPLYEVSSLRTDLLPSYAPVGSPPSLASIVTKFSGCLRMDHHRTYPRFFRPWDVLWDYQPNNVNEVAEAMIRLMFNDATIAQKLPALIQLTQSCIDRLHAVMLGYRHGSTGHNPGHRTSAGWAAVMLDIASGVSFLADPSNPSYQEAMFLVKPGSRTLWGLSATETQYWNYLRGLGGNQSYADPYGHVDGGRLVVTGSGGPGGAYQKILSQPLKAAALVSILMPSLQVSWRTGHFALLEEYARRWVTHGVWASPDPVAPYSSTGTYGVTYGPDPGDPGEAILGSGRFPGLHGLNADGGQYKSAFVAAVWNAYSGDPVPPVIPAPTPEQVDAPEEPPEFDIPPDVGSPEEEPSSVTLPPVESTISYEIDGLSVKFFDRSTFTAQTWTWNFGDGTGSTVREPSHTFSAFGEYLVTLTVTCGIRTSSITKKVILLPNNLPGIALAVNGVSIGCGVLYDGGIAGDPVVITEYTVTSTGDVALVLAPISVPGAEYYLASQLGALTLEPGDSTTFQVGFINPYFIGTYGTTIPIVSNAGPCSAVLQFSSPNVLFEQYDGDFTYPACAFPSGDGDFYRTQTIGGTSRVKYGPAPLAIHTGGCGVGDELGPPGGVIHGVNNTSFSGSVTYDLDCNPSGGMSALIQREGGFGFMDFPGSPGTSYLMTTTNTGDPLLSLESVLAHLSSHRGVFAAGRYSESKTDETFSRIWSSPVTPSGYFSAIFGGPFANIYCNGSGGSAISSDLITPEDLGISVARVGEPARTQEVTSYNSGTRTTTGTKSRVTFNLEVDQTRPSLTAEVVFLITPTVGDPYRIIILRDYTISGPSLQIQINFPQVVGATVYAESWFFSYQKSLIDDFSSYAHQVDYISLPAISSWGFEGDFMCPTPNADCWDGFEFNLEVGQVTSLVYGYAWAFSGLFISKDTTDVYDYFEGYPEGEIPFLTLGVGWVGGGALMFSAEAQCYDDFSSYADGAITDLDFIADEFYPGWIADGAIVFVADNDAFDAFETYAIGAITDLDYTSSNNIWLTDGEFL